METPMKLRKLLDPWPAAPVYQQELLDTCPVAPVHLLGAAVELRKLLDT